MKQPIEPSDIKAGDLVRVEAQTANNVSTVTSMEFVARCDGMAMSGRLDKWGARERAYYLLDRPKPAIELPTEDHHFGWLSAPGTRLARPGVAGEWFFGDQRITASGFSDGINRESVTAWVTGTLVPAAALDELRKAVHDQQEGIADRIAHTAWTFLAAVDEAATS